MVVKSACNSFHLQRLGFEINTCTSMSKIALPDKILQELQCIFCNGFLSHFPVYTYPGEGTVACGRCPILQDENPVRDIAYERVAKAILFPCCYKSYGCLEEMVPESLEIHEECCLFKQYFCPFIPLGTCSWQGPLKELLAHYEEVHEMLVLHGYQFEIDLINKYEENYLVPFGSSLFVLHVRCDLAEERLWMSLRFIGHEKQAAMFSYEAAFSTNNFPNGFTMLKEGVQCDSEMSLDKNKAVNVFIDKLRQQFMNPTYVICKINIIDAKPKKEKVISGSRMEDAMSQICNEDILKTLECPVCFQFLIPPIHQCVAGHSICNTCKPSLTVCPTCRCELGNTRNFMLESMTAHIRYPCKYREFDCDFTSTAQEIRAHESECIFGPYECPLKVCHDCDWKHKLEYVISHVRTTHEDNILDLESVNVLFTEDEADEESYILTKFDQIFRLAFKYDCHNFFFSMQLVGLKTAAADYMFEIDFVDLETCERTYFKRKCSPLSSEELIFAVDSDYLKVPREQLDAYIVDESISLKCRILSHL